MRAVALNADTVARNKRDEAERLATRLPALLVAARRIAAGITQGLHGRRSPGPGEAFWQFRDYGYGDPATAIDWRRSARNDRLYVRERELEAAQTLWLWVRAGPGMDWKSDLASETKRDRAELLALALGVLMVQAGERVGLLDAMDVPSLGQGAVDKIGLLLARNSPTDAVPTRRDVTTRAHLVWISDFLMPLDDLSDVLMGFSERSVHGHLVRIADPAEETLPYTGRVTFTTPEGVDRWQVSNVDAVRDAYQGRVEGHRKAVEAIARHTGFGLISHRTDQSPQTALLALYSALSGGARWGQR